MRKNLTLRSALLTVSDLDTTTHPLNTKVVIKLTATLPLLLIDQQIVNDTIVHDPVITTGGNIGTVLCGIKDDADLLDPTSGYIENRFILVTVFQASVSKVKNNVYYDKLHKDLIIIPDISYFNQFDTVGKPIEINGFRIGGINPESSTPFKPYLPISQNDAVALPTAKTKISNKLSYNLIPGMFTRHGNNDIQIEQQLQHGFNHYRTEGTPGVFVNLGKITDLFETTADHELPLQMVYQDSPARFSAFGLGITKTNNSDLYIMMQI